MRWQSPERRAAAAAGDLIYPWAWSPPGRWLFLATALAVLFALDASSRDSYSVWLTTWLVSLVVAVVWLFRFVHDLVTTRFAMPVGHWLRWLAIPLIFFVWSQVVQTDLPFDARLLVSRGPMDRAAAEVMAGSPIPRGWIGLYPTEAVERTSNGMRFLIAESGFFDRVGFAYAPDGEPAGEDGTDVYEPLGGGWWRWTAKLN